MKYNIGDKLKSPRAILFIVTGFYDGWYVLRRAKDGHSCKTIFHKAFVENCFKLVKEEIILKNHKFTTIFNK